MAKLNKAEKCLIKNIEQFREKYRTVVLATKAGVLAAISILLTESPEKLKLVSLIKRFDELYTLVNEVELRMEYKCGSNEKALFFHWSKQEIENEFLTSVNTRTTFDEYAFKDFQSEVLKQIACIESVDSDNVRNACGWIFKMIKDDLERIIKEYRNS